MSAFSLPPSLPHPCLYSYSALLGNDGSCLVTKFISFLHYCHAATFPFLPSFILLPPVSPSLALSLSVCPRSSLSRTPPSFGRGSAASGRPASPATGCGSESGTHPWSRRRRGRWCGCATGGSCKTKPLQRDGWKEVDIKIRVNNRKHSTSC